MNIAEISLYPEPDAKHIMTSGVASYTKNLLQGIPFSKHDNVYILCEKKRGVSNVYKDDKFTILRTFDKNYKFIWQIYKQLTSLKPEVIHFQQEVALYGGIFNAYLLSWLIFKFKKSNTVITFHQIVNQSLITKKFVSENNSNAPVILVKLAFKLIYKTTSKYTKAIIVHEDYFKDLLTEQYGVDGRKIHVIPHGVEDLKQQNNQKARKYLGIKAQINAVLFMGYLTGYKGIDLLIDGFALYAKVDPNAYLIIGAGKHPKYLKNENYLHKYKFLKNKASKQINKVQYSWVGFIAEDELATYYSATNLSIYPYTISMSSSGPMAIAIGFEKPFIGSEAFHNVLPVSLLFEQTPVAICEKLKDFFGSQHSYQLVTSKLKGKRLWNNVGKQTMAIYTDLVA